MNSKHPKNLKYHSVRSKNNAGKRAGRSSDALRPKVDNLSGKKHFLGIAIDEYQHWPRLRNAKRDVLAISELLTETYGFSGEDITFLKDEEATEENIIGALHSKVGKVGNKDSLIIYYAGHGHLANDTKRGYWVPVDARNGVISDYIQNSVIQDYLKDIPSLHTLLLSDSCFSGSLLDANSQRAAKLMVSELMQYQSRWAICSGRHDETVADGPPDGHSPFAESILDVLGKTEREFITLDFLLDQVRQQTRTNYGQLPEGGALLFANHKRGQFVFIRQTSKEPADELAWKKLSEMPEESIEQLQAKGAAVVEFCNQFHYSGYIPSAGQLGKSLLQKRRYLSLTDDEAELCEFLVQYPDSPYTEEILQRLDDIRRHGNAGSTITTVPKQPLQTGQSVEVKQDEDQSIIHTNRDPSGHTTTNETSKSVNIQQANAFRKKWSMLGVIIALACVIVAFFNFIFSNSNTDSGKNHGSATHLQGSILQLMDINILLNDKGKSGKESTELKRPLILADESRTILIDGSPDTSEYVQKETDQELSARFTNEYAGAFVLVKAGSFDMGCTEEQHSCESDEKPVHRVILSSYYIGQYEITQAQWRKVMDNNPSKFAACDQCPVEQVSWNEVQEFIQRLNAMTGQNYRLPTEAEWEFAARGGRGRRLYQYAGSNNPEGAAWFVDNSQGRTHRVGEKLPNRLMLYDMSGNVWEWCQDRKGGYSSTTQTNPTGASTGSFRVCRGGSWDDDPEDCRVAFRYFNSPSTHRSDVGFRLAMSL